MTSTPVDRQLMRLIAVELLLTSPEELGNDALETDLYILRDQLRAAVQSPPAPRALSLVPDLEASGDPV